MKNLLLATKILSKINTLGYEAYIVGGAVRDHLLKLDVFDIDIATSMPIDKVSEIFDIIDNGSKYLSVTIKLEDNLFEITQFRKDLRYDDHRHPIVEPALSFVEDTKRRDFTINALAYDSNLNLVDYHNGINDIDNRIIRTIGNPKERFSEDALRILRGLYLSSKLNFEIEENTIKAMVEKRKLLSSLSDERLFNNTLKILNQKYDIGLKYIHEYNLFEYIPIYKRLIDIYNNNLSNEDIIYLYYIKFKDYLPIVNNNHKRVCKSINDLITSNFSILSIYKNLDNIYKIKNVLKHLNYDIDYINNVINNLKIKNDKELALSKEEITKNFIGNEKSKIINKVLINILEGKIKNTEEDIKNLINRS